MSTMPKCPKCSSELTYEDGSMYICPECAHEWSKEATGNATEQRRMARANNVAFVPCQPLHCAIY
jgi:protein PhnA